MWLQATKAPKNIHLRYDVTHLQDGGHTAHVGRQL